MMQGDRKDMEMKDLYNNDNYSDGYYYITVTMKNALSAFSQLISTTTPWRTNIIPILQIIKLRHTSNMSKVTQRASKGNGIYSKILTPEPKLLDTGFFPTHTPGILSQEKQRADLICNTSLILLIQRKKALLKLSKITALPSFQLLPPTLSLYTLLFTIKLATI